MHSMSSQLQPYLFVDGAWTSVFADLAVLWYATFTVMPSHYCHNTISRGHIENRSPISKKITAQLTLIVIFTSSFNHDLVIFSNQNPTIGMSPGRSGNSSQRGYSVTPTLDPPNISSPRGFSSTAWPGQLLASFVAS